MGDGQQSSHALQQTLRIARLHGLNNSAKRAQVQWVLLHDGKGVLPKLEKDLPADIALSLGYALAKRQDVAGASLAYHHVLTHASEEKSGLLLQARAMMGLASLPVKGEASGIWAEKALKLLRKVGAPRKTAEALLMVAKDEHYNLKQRRDAAQRATTIYHILQDTHGKKVSEDVAQSLGLEGEQ